MAPFGPWADIPADLLAQIIDGLRHLESYCRARGVCTAWRAALPPPIASLVTVTATVPPPGASSLYYRDRHSQEVSALFLQAERSFPLATIQGGSLCVVVGSSNDWLAIDARSGWKGMGIYLVSPLSGRKEIPLLPQLKRWHRDKPVTKVVFSPNPKPDDYVAIAIYDLRRLAYGKTRDLNMKWMILDVAIGQNDRFIDLAYDIDGGKVYCVTLLGDVHVLHMPRRQRRRPIVEPLLDERAGLPFDPATAYAPPYDTASKFTSVKHVFFFGGDLYQVWRNATGARSWLTPDGGQFVMLKDDIFVLKYNPERRPCWDAVTDLGGYSVFVGKNHPVVLHPKDAPGVTANCVYWINEQSRNEPMVFDMVTRTSTLHPSAAKALSPPFKAVCCWYFLDDKVSEQHHRKLRKFGSQLGREVKTFRVTRLLPKIAAISPHLKIPCSSLQSRSSPPPGTEPFARLRLARSRSVERVVVAAAAFAPAAWAPSDCRCESRLPAWRRRLLPSVIQRCPVRPRRRRPPLPIRWRAPALLDPNSCYPSRPTAPGSTPVSALSQSDLANLYNRQVEW